MICAVCWNPSNLLGLYISFRGDFSVAPTSPDLLIFIGPKCLNSTLDLDIVRNLFCLCGFSVVKIIPFSSSFERFLLSLSPFLLRPRLFVNCLISSFYFYLPTPANPPLSLGLLWYQKYYYGDGIGVRPVLNYQWQPSISNSPFRFALRRTLLYSSCKLTNLFSRTHDVSSGLLGLQRTSEFFSEFSRAVHRPQLAVFLTTVPSGHQSLITVVMSMLSPVRVSPENEVRLYVEFLSSKLSGFSADSSVLYFKFHYHHDSEFRRIFISRMANHFAGFRVEEAPSSVPAESIVLGLLDSFPSRDIIVFAFQESAKLLDCISSSSGSNFSFFFGFPDRLVKKFFRHSEVERRIQYQRNVRKVLTSLQNF